MKHGAYIVPQFTKESIRERKITSRSKWTKLKTYSTAQSILFATFQTWPETKRALADDEVTGDIRDGRR